MFVIFAATTAAGCSPCGDSKTCVKIKGECVDIHSSKYIDLDSRSSGILNKVIETNIADSDAKKLQNYPLAFEEGGERIPLLQDVPVLCTKLTVNGAECSEYPKLRVYTDNDDTVKCSGMDNTHGAIDAGKSWVAGCDQSCIHGSYYVGVAQFYHELSTIGGDGSVEYKKPGTSATHEDGKGVFVVSAAPGSFLNHYHEGTLMGVLAKGYIAGNFRASVGGVGTQWKDSITLFDGDKRGKRKPAWLDPAIAKGNKIHKEVEEKPGLKNNIVWLGDDGQGDALTAVLVAAIVRVSFIHRVSNDTSNQGWYDQDELHGFKPREIVKLQQHAEKLKNIVYFNTYPEAAELAMQLGLITSDAAMRIHEASLNSALGRACCDEKECVITSELNKNDNTCGTEVIHGDVVYAADADGKKTLKWNLSKYCAPVRDAWGYWSDKEGTKGIKCSKGGPSGTLIKK